MSVFTALRVRPFDPERSAVEVAAVRLGIDVEVEGPGDTRIAYVGDELTEVGRYEAHVNTVFCSLRHWEDFPRIASNVDASAFCAAQPLATQADVFQWSVERGALRVLLGEEEGNSYAHVLLLAHCIRNAGSETTAYGPATSGIGTTTDASLGLFPRLVRALLADGASRFDFELSIFQNVEHQVWDLLDATSEVFSAESGDPCGAMCAPGGENPRSVRETVDTVRGTAGTQRCCWIGAVALSGWRDFAEARDFAHDNARRTASTAGPPAMYDGHVFSELRVTERATGVVRTLLAVRLVADPVHREAKIVRRKLALAAYGATRACASMRFEEEHPEEHAAFHRRQLGKIAAVHEVGDMLAAFHRSRRAPPGSTKKREWRRQYARFTANYLKARLPDALTLVVGAIRPEAETSREMRGTLAFFDRVTGSADRQEVGGFAAAADSGMVVNDAP